MFPDLLSEKIPLLVLVAFNAVLTFLVQQSSGAMGMLGQQVPLGIDDWAMPFIPAAST